MEAYPLPARPLPIDTLAPAVVDLRDLVVDDGGLSGLSPWQWALEYVRRCVTTSAMDQHEELVEDPIKEFDAGSGSDRHQLARVLEALDQGRAVAFYGWWPTAELAAVSDILGVDAMDVPTPDRKGAGLADGHAVVALGYGLHAAFPGGGYLIVRNPWRDVGWGHAGDGYLPFTYVRAYGTALQTFRGVGDGAGHRAPAGRRSGFVPAPATSKPIETVISNRARCADPRSSYTALFFSENPVDMIRAKAICAKCAVRQLCLSRALERAEPYGVWGGEFLYEGRVVTGKRGRGRPRKVALPTNVDEITGMPIVA